jgi:hypothetical protein
MQRPVFYAGLTTKRRNSHNRSLASAQSQTRRVRWTAANNSDGARLSGVVDSQLPPVGSLMPIVQPCGVDLAWLRPVRIMPAGGLELALVAEYACFCFLLRTEEKCYNSARTTTQFHIEQLSWRRWHPNPGPALTGPIWHKEDVCQPLEHFPSRSQ